MDEWERQALSAEDADAANIRGLTMKDFHFFAANALEWVVTQPTYRELPDLIQYMEKQNMPYNLWLVPGKWDLKYSIEWYEPKIDGAQCLGSFRPKKERDAARKKQNKKIDTAVWGTV